MKYEYKPFYRRKLPHRHSPGGILFVTFRLYGAIPKVVLKEWRNTRDALERELAITRDPKSEIENARIQFYRSWFAKFERLLDSSKAGPLWLKDVEVAKIVYDSLVFRNGKEYELFAFCIMSNHVHVLFKPILTERSLTSVQAAHSTKLYSEHPPLGNIMQSLKGYTARKANLVLKRTGPFWDAESYDHQVRNDDEFYRIKRYILNNPVKAGLVCDWRDWRWSFDSALGR
jgi:putative transposase